MHISPSGDLELMFDTKTWLIIGDVVHLQSVLRFEFRAICWPLKGACCQMFASIQLSKTCLYAIELIVSFTVMAELPNLDKGFFTLGRASTVKHLYFYLCFTIVFAALFSC